MSLARIRLSLRGRRPDIFLPGAPPLVAEHLSITSLHITACDLVRLPGPWEATAPASTSVSKHPVGSVLLKTAATSAPSASETCAAARAFGATAATLRARTNATRRVRFIPLSSVPRLGLVGQ